MREIEKKLYECELITYEYDTEEMAKSHIIEMEDLGYEVLGYPEEINGKYLLTFRKWLDIKTYRCS